MWKVCFINAIKSNIDHDKFETEQEARAFAAALERRGYHIAAIIPCDNIRGKTYLHA